MFHFETWPARWHNQRVFHHVMNERFLILWAMLRNSAVPWDLYKFLSDDLGNLCTRLPFSWIQCTQWFVIDTGIHWIHDKILITTYPDDGTQSSYDLIHRHVRHSRITAHVGDDGTMRRGLLSTPGSIITYAHYRSIYITIPVLYTPVVRQDRVFIESNILVLSNIGLYCTHGSIIT